MNLSYHSMSRLIFIPALEIAHANRRAVDRSKRDSVMSQTEPVSELPHKSTTSMNSADSTEIGRESVSVTGIFFVVLIKFYSYFIPTCYKPTIMSFCYHYLSVDV